MPSYEAETRDWDLEAESFVSGLVKAIEQPTDTAYVEGVAKAMVQAMDRFVPVVTGELQSSLRYEILSPTRFRILMAYYGVWVDRGHRVYRSSVDRYRIQSDKGSKNLFRPSSNFLWRSRAANFVKRARESAQVAAAIDNVKLLFRRIQVPGEKR